MLCYALPGNVYPVTEAHDSDASLMRDPLKAGYNSHFALTEKNGFVLKERIDGGDEKPFDELVVGQEAQIVPAFILKLEKGSALTNLLKTYERETPATSPPS